MLQWLEKVIRSSNILKSQYMNINDLKNKRNVESYHDFIGCSILCVYCYHIDWKMDSWKRAENLCTIIKKYSEQQHGFKILSLALYKYLQKILKTSVFGCLKASLQSTEIAVFFLGMCIRYTQILYRRKLTYRKLLDLLLLKFCLRGKKWLPNYGRMIFIP